MFESLNDFDLIMRIKELTNQSNLRNQAFEQLIERHMDWLFDQMYSITCNEDEADKLVWEVFLHVWLHLDSLQPTSRFRGWLRTVAHRYAIDNWRREQRHRAIPLDHPEFLANSDHSANDNPLRAILQRETIERVCEMLERIDPLDRAILLLRHGEGRKCEEIAEELEVSIEEVYRRTFRAMTELR